MRLIDADELKDIISEEVTRKFVRWDKTITVSEWETFIRDIIDNAPTVAVNCNDCDGYEAGYSAGLKDAERPQGEWKTTGAYPHKIYCNKCYKTYAQENWEVWKDGSLPRNFCPNCGADMRGKLNDRQN